MMKPQSQSGQDEKASDNLRTLTSQAGGVNSWNLMSRRDGIAEGKSIPKIAIGGRTNLKIYGTAENHLCTLCQLSIVDPACPAPNGCQRLLADGGEEGDGEDDQAAEDDGEIVDVDAHNEGCSGGNRTRGLLGMNPAR
jgi:hypothetical protein